MRDLQVTLTLGSLARLNDIQFVPHKACFVRKALFCLQGVAVVAASLPRALL